MRISDWSSDVCSSDRAERLPLETGQEAGGLGAGVRLGRQPIEPGLQDRRHGQARRGLEGAVEQGDGVAAIAVEGLDRSEARRVGKECVSTCRSRWSPSRLNKNIIQHDFVYNNR